MRLMQKSRKTIRRAMYFLHFLCQTSKFMVLMYERHYAKCQAITIRYGHCSLLWTVLKAPLHLSKFESAWKESKKDSWNRKRKKVTKHTQRRHIRGFQPFVRLKQDDIRHRVENSTNVTKENNIKGLLFCLSLP